MQDYSNYILVALIAGFFIWKWFRFRAVKSKLPEYLKSGAIVIDVRSAGEYASGHFEGSINIPLQDLASKAKQLDKNKMILLCCASGTRSGMAATILKGQGFHNVQNVGPWTNLF